MIEFILSQIKQAVSSNQFLSGGLVLGMLTGIAVWLRNIPGKIASLFTRHYIVNTEIRNSEECFIWFARWFHSRNFQRKTNILSLSISRDESGENPRLTYSPGIGIHFFWYKRRPFWMSRDRSEPSIASESMRVPESFTVKTFRCFKKDMMEMFDAAKESYFLNVDDSIAMYVPDWNSWRKRTKLHHRAIDTVFLDDDLMNGLIADIEQFTGNEQFYRERGVPYRRGYLFHGPPGTGKTTTISALASYFKADIFYLSLTSSDVSDNGIADIMQNVKKGAFIVIEDIDAVKSSQRETKESAKADVSFPALLNALDGIGSQEGRIVFMTTNHREKLDKALIRPGRIDCQTYFGYASQHQMIEMFRRFYPGEGKETELRFLEKYGHQKELTTAMLQEIFLSCKTAADVLVKETS
jgi:chaperone BCS1